MLFEITLPLICKIPLGPLNPDAMDIPPPFPSALSLLDTVTLFSVREVVPTLALIPAPESLKPEPVETRP